jgi:hypothetical protein
MNGKFFILGVLMLAAIFGGCISGEGPQPPLTTTPSDGEPQLAGEDTFPTVAEEETIPYVTDITDEELIEEPDFDVEETVDLGTIL